MKRRTLSALAAAVFLALSVAACGGGETTTTGATETTAPPNRTVHIVFKNGKVVGGLQKATFNNGDHVVLVVSSDIADEVHLHGYDKHADVAPGKPVRLAFVASLPGRFEAELESRGIQIADLEVRP